jgi:adenine-specific DNA-methyltransferase
VMDLRVGDCLDVLRTLPDKSVNLIATDPPYFRVKGEAWDNAWKDSRAFLEWLGVVADEWRRVLTDNGTLYCFASPQMAARVQVMLAERFTILNEVVWVSPTGKTSQRVSREILRKFLPVTERLIVAEQFGADGSALMGSGYDAACADLHAGVFEPLRRYLDDERARSGVSVRRVAEEYQKVTGSRTVTGMAGHWFQVSQWCLPTEANYLWLRELLGADYLRREYEDLRREYEDLRREYEDLRREYEDLRRPFSVTASVPHHDVWTYPSVPAARKGARRHPCEKPLDMMRHIVTTSSRPGDVVLDCFIGSGATAVAAQELGREFIGCDMDPEWVEHTRRRLERIDDAPRQLTIEDAA